MTEMSGEQAFPAAYCVGPNDDLYPPTPGMTLRDWFAGQALAGMLASEAGIQPYPQKWAAERAYILADALLLERARKDGE